MRKNDVICPKCKGTKKIILKVSTYADKTEHTEMTIPCVYCQSAGYVSAETIAQWEYEKTLWCRCSKDSYTFGSYPEDGKCTCGMYKHHVHCGTCEKISQVG